MGRPRARLQGDAGKERWIELGSDRRRQVERDSNRSLIEAWRLLAAQDPCDPRSNVADVGGPRSQDLVVQRFEHRGRLLSGFADGFLRGCAVVDPMASGVEQLGILGHQSLSAKDLRLVHAAPCPQALLQRLQFGGSLLGCLVQTDVETPRADATGSLRQAPDPRVGDARSGRHTAN